MKAAAFAITVLQSKLRSDPYLPEIRKSPPQKGWTSLFLLVKAGLNMQFLSEPANRLPGYLLPLHPGCTQVLPPARPSKRHPATPTEDGGQFCVFNSNYLDLAICFAMQNAIYGFAIRYDINPPTPRRAYRIEDISHRLSGISQIPTGFISLLTKNCLPKKAVLLLAISP